MIIHISRKTDHYCSYLLFYFNGTLNSLEYAVPNGRTNWNECRWKWMWPNFNYCPNIYQEVLRKTINPFSQETWSVGLSSSSSSSLLLQIGLGGKPRLVEIGGPPYLLPLVQREKLYDMSYIGKLTDIEPSFLIGAGAGPWPYAGVNCEVILKM